MSESSDLQPTLVGPTILVRPIEPGDWEEMFRVASDPQIWALHPSSDRYQEGPFREFFSSALASGGAFAFVDRASGKIIGSSRYKGLKPELSELEIGWTFLSRDYWGGNANREIKKLMLEHAFTFVDCVTFWVGASNYRSRAAMEKIGGVLRESGEVRTIKGIDYPHVQYEIRKKDFKL